jgi:hypothetical protein
MLNNILIFVGAFFAGAIFYLTVVGAQVSREIRAHFALSDAWDAHREEGRKLEVLLSCATHGDRDGLAVAIDAWVRRGEALVARGDALAAKGKRR